MVTGVILGVFFLGIFVVPTVWRISSFLAYHRAARSFAEAMEAIEEEHLEFYSILEAECASLRAQLQLRKLPLTSTFDLDIANYTSIEA